MFLKLITYLFHNNYAFIFEKNIKQEDYNAANLFFNKKYIISFVRIKYQKFAVVYVYGDEREYIESFEHKSDFKIDNILTFDDRVAYDTMIDQNDEKSLLVSFLFPEIHEGGHLDNLTKSVVFLVFKNKLIIFTKQKLKFIPELLSNMVLHDVDNFMQEVFLKIMQKDFHVMLDDLRGVKEKIDDLDSEISTSGSLRPTFGDLLTLQKYMIALSTTYGANHKALDFIKKNFTTINDIDFTTQK